MKPTLEILQKLIECYTRVACCDHHKTSDFLFDVTYQMCAYTDGGWYVIHPGYLDTWQVGPHEKMPDAISAACLRLALDIQRHIEYATSAFVSGNTDTTYPTQETIREVEEELEEMMKESYFRKRKEPPLLADGEPIPADAARPQSSTSETQWELPLDHAR